MKATLLLASALALPLCYSTAMAGEVTPESFVALNGLQGADGPTGVALTNDQLAAVDGTGKRYYRRGNTATGTGGAGGAGGPGGAGGCNGIASCVNAQTTVTGSNTNNQGNGGAGGAGGPGGGVSIFQ